MEGHATNGRKRFGAQLVDVHLRNFIVPWSWYERERWTWSCPKVRVVIFVDGKPVAGKSHIAQMQHSIEFGYVAHFSTRHTLTALEDIHDELGTLHLQDVRRATPAALAPAAKGGRGGGKGGWRAQGGPHDPNAVCFYMVSGKCPCEHGVCKHVNTQEPPVASSTSPATAVTAAATPASGAGGASSSGSTSLAAAAAAAAGPQPGSLQPGVAWHSFHTARLCRCPCHIEVKVPAKYGSLAAVGAGGGAGGGGGGVAKKPKVQQAHVKDCVG